MASLQDLRRRVRAVRNMQQVTRAMKMVSAAKLRRVQERVIAARPYAQSMTAVLQGLAERAEQYRHPLLEPRREGQILLVLITADKGLCGAYNTNLIRAAQAFLERHSGARVELVCIGRKGRDFFRRHGVPIRAEYTGVTARQVELPIAREIARSLIADFLAPEPLIEKVVLLYNEFKSAARQQIVVEQLLPIAQWPLDGERKPREVFIDYLYEQPPAEIFDSLLPRYVEAQVYRALLEATASEHGARMMAMDAATKNAEEMIASLTLQMNRVRQATITKQIIEVVSGAAALEEMLR
ncbi:MAG: ATP synthase F1 subunit gamma [Blastocatellia bacterium]|nr:ATP synthase F1 subunit gamma [Blastocatellia bacterium]